MSRTLCDALRWTKMGSDLLLSGLCDVENWDVETLPGWTRRHLIAHVAANADALGNLVEWAATGVETPMYTSPRDRAAGIARGSRLTAADLHSWLVRSINELDAAMAGLTPGQWQSGVRTAQGRLVPASEIPWLRSREVLIHAADLGAGIGFAQLPDDFLRALVDEITAKRGIVRPSIEGPLPEIAAWLAGRTHQLIDAPPLDPWL